MASRVDPTPDSPDQSAIRLLNFFVVYVTSAAAWVPILRSGRPLLALPGSLTLLTLVTTLMPSLVTIVLSGRRDGWSDTRALLGQAGKWRFGLPWYAVALSLTVLPDLLALVVSGLLDSSGGALGPVQLQLLLPFAPAARSSAGAATPCPCSNGG